ncbi:MAG: hypothetical protein KGH63_00515 [Candidatus Micrarchaeota archaeon]|nr:hypothetical protein [Candidatus Micrarchaeota archaeon]
MEKPRPAKEILRQIWQPPQKPLSRGAWLWWFWLFFIRDKNTRRTGRCRQIMILWSVKNDAHIVCNEIDLRPGKPIAPDGENFALSGATAAWYFDGAHLREDFLLHPSKMKLSPGRRSLDAPGGKETSSSCVQRGNDFITSIRTPRQQFELVARQADSHPAVGPVHGHTPMGLGMEIEGTRIERMELRGWEKNAKGKRRKISGTAYFQKILLAAPPPAWYWGLYHFADGSIATFMQVYAGRASLRSNLLPAGALHRPRLSLKEDILVYHAPTKKVYEGHRLRVSPSRLEGAHLWRHNFEGSGPGFTISGQADAYAHACWTFQKSIGMLPARSTFKYNEYPAVLRTLTIRPARGKLITLKNGWGNMENAWGFLI